MNTLLLAFALASALAASAVLGRSSGPTPERLTYVEEERIRGQVDETAQVVAVGDRSANLKYVMAIQSSSMWTDIKRRSLTTNSARRLDDAAADKPPNDLSDEELARLKQACHDGLKCVAVDQLLVLKRVREPLADGNTSVRMAITKITQVISKYTSEYHEDVYQYEEVTQSDDPSKVYESVTNIVEDNQELCQIDVSAVDAGKENATGPPKNSDGGEDDARPTTVVNNNNTVNFNTTKNYNINNGTVNNATVNMAAPEGADGVSVTLSSDDGPAAENGSPDDADRQPTGRSTAADGSPPTGNGSSAAVSPENASPPVDSRPPALLMITDESHHDTAASAPNTPNVDGGSSRRDAGGNTATIVNRSGGGSGSNDSDADVVSAGPHNRADVKKGLVEDGYFNNGNMKVKNFDRSNRNKGTIKNSSADHGIIGIGTINNGPVNYGTTNVYKNDGNIADIGNLDIQAYATSIDKMYSAILNKLANKD